jgi:phenylacetic acid degradation operon negative regulatory protein
MRMDPSAKSLVLDLLSTLQPGSAMPVGALVEAGDLFDLSGNNIRVTLARLLAAGQIDRDERGRYGLGEKSKPVERRVRSWRDLSTQTRRWSGEWIGLYTASAGRTQRRARTRALQLFGFAQLRPSMWLRPDNLSASLDEVHRDLAALGLPAGDMVFVLRQLDDASEQHARSLWDIAAMERAYRKLREQIEISRARLANLPTGEAMAESYLLGGRALRSLILDPLLPQPICSNRERDALLTTMRDYDRLGRLAWAELLKRHQVPYLRTPIDSRIAV